MTELNDERLPPLGERTPGRPGRSRAGTPWYKRPSVAGVAGIVLGLLVGVGLAASADDDRDRSPVDLDRSIETTVPRPTTTLRPLPRECAEALRTAEQSLALLDQAFQSARRFDVAQLDRMLSELQDVRRGLTERVRTCVEGA